MKRLVSVLLVTILGAVSYAQSDNEQELRQFIDGFFTEFSHLSETMWEKQKKGQNAKMMDLVHLTQQHFIRPTEESVLRTGKVDSIDVIANLWPLVPKEWVVENMRVAGDVARAKISFVPSRGPSREIVPFEVRFIREGEEWKFLRMKDLRPKKESETIELPTGGKVEAVVSAQGTLSSFLNYLVANRDAVDIRNPATLRPAIEQITEGVADLWQKSPESNRARNEAIAKLMMQDMEAWEITESATTGEDSWEATVQLTMGERNPMAAFMRVKPTVKFQSKKDGETWLLTGFQLAR